MAPKNWSSSSKGTRISHNIRVALNPTEPNKSQDTRPKINKANTYKTPKWNEANKKNVQKIENTSGKPRKWNLQNIRTWIDLSITYTVSIIMYNRSVRLYRNSPNVKKKIYIPTTVLLRSFCTLTAIGRIKNLEQIPVEDKSISRKYRVFK